MAGKDEIKEVLAGIVTGSIFYDEPMSLHTSMGVGGSADALVFVENEAELVCIVGRLKEQKIDFLPVGNLTNVIVRDGGYRGVIIVMRELNNINCQNNPEEGYRITAQAGVSLNRVINRAVMEHLTGMEFCAGIPGSVGGAVWMNAGAYGKEMKDVIAAITILNDAGEKITVPVEEITFSYRKTILPPGAIILAAEFLLTKGYSAEIKEKIAEIMRLRQEKHPLEYPNSGSIFKNMPKQPAGKIIEELGLKGIRRGNAEVSPKHANFIVNKGGATAADVLELMELIQNTVMREKSLKLEPEVVITGED